MFRSLTKLRDQKGFTLIELLVTVAIIAVIAALGIPVYINAVRQAHEASLVGDGQQVLKAMQRNYLDYSQFPATSGAGSFELATFEPLATRGYLSTTEAILVKLDGRQVTAYDSPDVGSPNSQFWAVLTLGFDPNVQLLVCATDQYPGHVGESYDGLYFIEGGNLVPIS